jgi:hypothetical protein
VRMLRGVIWQWDDMLRDNGRVNVYGGCVRGICVRSVCVRGVCESAWEMCEGYI